MRFIFFSKVSRKSVRFESVKKEGCLGHQSPVNFFFLSSLTEFLFRVELIVGLLSISKLPHP